MSSPEWTDGPPLDSCPKHGVSECFECMSEGWSTLAARVRALESERDELKAKVVELKGVLLSFSAEEVTVHWGWRCRICNDRWTGEADDSDPLHFPDCPLHKEDS